MPQTKPLPIEIQQFLRDFNRKELKTRYGSMSYIDDGDPNAGRTILFMHGNPTWSYLYRHLLRAFRRSYRVIAPDLIGFGMSDKPHILAAYDVQSQVDAVMKLMEALRLESVIVVGQDWGGPISALVAQKLGENCRGLILMNTYIPGLRIFNQFGRSSLKTSLGKWLIINLDLFRFTAFRLGFKQHVSKEIREAYMFPHGRLRDRLGVWAFPAQIPDNNSYSNHSQEAIQLIDNYLTCDQVKKLLLFSDGDPIFHLKKIRKVRRSVANATYHEIQGAGHFLQEDQPKQVIRNIQKWLKALETRVD